MYWFKWIMWWCAKLQVSQSHNNNCSVQSLAARTLWYRYESVITVGFSIYNFVSCFIIVMAVMKQRRIAYQWHVQELHSDACMVHVFRGMLNAIVEPNVLVMQRVQFVSMWKGHFEERKFKIFLFPQMDRTRQLVNVQLKPKSSFAADVVKWVFNVIMVNALISINCAMAILSAPTEVMKS